MKYLESVISKNRADKLKIMKIGYWIIIVFLINAVPGKALQTFNRISFEESGSNRGQIAKVNFVFIDTTGLIDILDVMSLDTSLFKDPSTFPRSKRSFYSWSIVSLFNNQNQVIDEFLRFPTYVDSIWVFETKEDKVISSHQLGIRMKPHDKLLPSNSNVLSFHLNPGEEKTYYIRFWYKAMPVTASLNWFTIENRKKIQTQLFNDYAFQCFYAGIMMIIGLVSGFMYFIFKEKIFLFFASAMIFFAAYFPKMSGIGDALLTHSLRNDYISIGQVLSSGLLISIFLFGSEYVSLKSKFPFYYKFFFFYTIFAASFYHIFHLFFQDQSWPFQMHNMIIVAWVLIGALPVILLALKGDKSSKHLIYCILSMMIAALINLLDRERIILGNTLTQRSFQIGTIIFSSVLFTSIFSKINSLQLERIRFKEIDELKSRFFANISHEFRTPLTLIMDPINKVLQNTSDKNDKFLLSLAYKNCEKILTLINQILDLSKLKANKIKLHPENVNIVPLVKAIVMSFESSAIDKNIGLKILSQSSIIPMYLDIDKIERILTNLVSNAFKYSYENTSITVEISETENHVSIAVTDQGIGIAEDQIDLIFDRYYQIDETEDIEQYGTGIGLAIVKEFVELHSGKLRVKSKKGKGSTFTVEFPKIIHADNLVSEHDGPELKNDTSINSILINQKEERRTLNETFIFETASDKPVVLIVEDNQDVRNYIKLNLTSSFRIIEASNGIEGRDIAFAEIPDLIISDIMMPRLNGYELCKLLKFDQRTSHIPILLLTAKADKADRIQGLEYRADDYLIKPFDTKELFIRINNLLEIRKNLQNMYAQKSFEAFSLNHQNSQELQFISSVVRHIEDNLSNEDLNVDFLSKCIAMSPRNLNRKLKAITDQSINQFIQNYRLHRAYQLLQQKKDNVSQISYQTGFKSPAYFVKCFREKYGKTPGAILGE